MSIPVLLQDLRIIHTFTAYTTANGISINHAMMVTQPTWSQNAVKALVSRSLARGKGLSNVQCDGWVQRVTKINNNGLVRDRYMEEIT